MPVCLDCGKHAEWLSMDLKCGGCEARAGAVVITYVLLSPLAVALLYILWRLV